MAGKPRFIQLVDFFPHHLESSPRIPLIGHLALEFPDRLSINFSPLSTARTRVSSFFLREEDLGYKTHFTHEMKEDGGDVEQYISGDVGKVF